MGKSWQVNGFRKTWHSWLLTRLHVLLVSLMTVASHESWSTIHGTYGKLAFPHHSGTCECLPCGHGQKYISTFNCILPYVKVPTLSQRILGTNIFQVDLHFSWHIWWLAFLRHSAICERFPCGQWQTICKGSYTTLTLDFSPPHVESVKL